MKIYSIFDDFGEEPVQILRNAGVVIDVQPLGVPRPDSIQMKKILEEYDGVIIGTSQKITEDMFGNITTLRIIATVSAGLDHIRIPPEKKSFITVLNTPKANAQSVAEYTIGCALACCKRLIEGRDLYLQGRDNKTLFQKPEDLSGKILGVVGAGNISNRIMEYGICLGMKVICWTPHPQNHLEIIEKGVKFAELKELLAKADVVSVNLPNNPGTEMFISDKEVSLMKNEAVFISVSRQEVIDYRSLFRKAVEHRGFYVCLDFDVNENVVKIIPQITNVIVTPHIAAGTVETRRRMFIEISEAIVKHIL